jgi:hypothetical protein
MSGEADVPGLTRLRREALVGASFSHSNLVSVYDVLNSDGGHLVIVMEASTASTSTASTANGATSASTTSTPAPSTTIASSAPAAGAGDPVSAVKSFYTLAAAHRYAAAWGLADASMQSQLGGYQSFQSGQAGDRSITFTSAKTVIRTPSSARVAITTTSVRSTGTQHCAGTVDLVPGAQRGNWQLHEIGINCS